MCEALAEAKSTAAQPAAEVEFWRQFLKSTAAFAQIAWSRSSDQSGLPLARQFNPRDAQMGDNMIWLARERYRLGAASFLELQEAVTIKARADRAYLIAVYSFHENMAALEAAVGRNLR